jgi:two-component system response regulator AtoC
MISAHATSEGVVESVKEGAFDYLLKPFSIDELLVTVGRAFEYARLWQDRHRLTEEARENRFRNALCGSHPDFVRCASLVRKVSTSTANVLITGETGVGKGLFAQVIHYCGKRSDGPFRIINCATLSDAPYDDNAGESALWNTLFDATEGGTLYLSHLSSLSPYLQGRLCDRMKGSRPVNNANGGAATGVRLIASVEVTAIVEFGAYPLPEPLRQSFDVIRIDTPPLRRRTEDIGALCDHFLRRIAQRNGAAPISLDPAIIPWLADYDWTGNIRELKETINHAAQVAKEGVIRLEDLPEKMRRRASIASLSYKEAKKRWLERFERRYLEELLMESNGNISRASERAGVARMSLYRMLWRNGMPHAGEKGNDDPGGDNNHNKERI